MKKQRPSTKIKCDSCGLNMWVRNDYVKKHSGKCMSCQKTGNSNATKHGGARTRLYGIWCGLKYRRYGGDTSVCNDWEDFTVFRDWALSNGYESHLTIDRVRNNIGYCPENCQWITRAENAGKDKRIFTEEMKPVLFKMRKDLGMTQRAFAEHLDVSRNTIQRLEKQVKQTT